MKKIEFTAPKQGKLHRVHQWVNTDTMEAMYGVECNVEYGRWVHVAVDGDVFLTPDRSVAKIAAKNWSAAA